MRTFWTIWKREVSTYFRTSLAAVLFFFSLLLTGFNFYASVRLLNHGPTDISIVEAFFNNLFFWGILLILPPLLSMRLFSEEYKTGTIETLMTAPVRNTHVLFAKFFGALFFFVLLWVPSLFYFILFWPSAHQVAAAGYGAYAGAYGMLLLQGTFYLALGCMASALTSHQLLAGISSLGMIVLFFFTGMLLHHLPSTISWLRDYSGLFLPMDVMKSFSRGLVDTRSIVFYLSMSFLSLVLASFIFQSRER